MGITLYDNDTGARIGRITDEQLQFLIDQLEEETLTDQDYFLNPTTLGFLEDNGGDPELIGMLKSAMGDREGIEIRWQLDD